MTRKSSSISTWFWGSINKKLTLLFFLVAFLAPAISIGFFYSISLSLLSTDAEIFLEQSAMLQSTAIIIIVLMALDAAVIGFFVSRSISKPIKQLHQATQEVEKGNFSIQTQVSTHDEIEQLCHAFNQTTIALSKMEMERQQIDKAKSEFLSITSHELRTPLTPMKAQLQMLENGYFGKLSEKQKQSVSIIKRNLQRLDKIIEDFLEISRIEAARLRFDFKQIDIRKVIEETVEFMKGFAQEKNITLSISTSQLPTIEADPDRIMQVLRNLIHNAIKFSPDNSTISVKATVEGSVIHFSVQDQGVGMDANEQIQVFEPFFQCDSTLDRKHGGTGLGLAICRGIVEAQKGKIWVHSTKGKGSTFQFTLPKNPVRDIEPITVLFSAKQDIERQLKEKFTSILGPIGIVEFNDLKQKHALGKQDLIKYIDQLKQNSILTHSQEQDFRKNIEMIYGGEHHMDVPQTTTYEQNVMDEVRQ